tara:strand:+ start:537 stop:710 length:174 start_codon:yes stop_codon:yes gene_type:complete
MRGHTQIGLYEKEYIMIAQPERNRGRLSSFLGLVFLERIYVAIDAPKNQNIDEIAYA